MMVPGALNAMSLGGARGIVVNSVDYDGSNDYLSRALAWTGAADGSQGLFSIWLRLDGNDGATRRLFITSAVASITLQLASSNKFFIQVSNSAATNVLSYTSNTANFTAGATWRNIQASWDTNFSAGNKLIKVAIDGVGDSGTVTDAQSSFNVGYATATPWGIGASPTNGSNFSGCMAEAYFNFAAFLDVTQSGNNQKFRTTSGHPVSLGPNGSTPTGSQPIIYFNGPAATVNVNAGSGGDATINGSPATCSSAP